MKLFSFSQNSLILNVPEILLYDDLAKILIRDKTIEKAKAYTEFKFIYIVADPASIPNINGYSIEKAFEHAIKECKFDSNFTPDSDLKKAIIKYEELNVNIASQVAEALLVAFSSGGEITIKINARIQKLLKVPELTLESIQEILKLQKELISIADSLPENIEKVLKAQNILTATKDTELLRGKKEISDSMRRDNQIDNAT